MSTMAGRYATTASAMERATRAMFEVDAELPTPEHIRLLLNSGRSAVPAACAAFVRLADQPTPEHRRLAVEAAQQVSAWNASIGEPLLNALRVAPHPAGARVTLAGGLATAATAARDLQARGLAASREPLDPHRTFLVFARAFRQAVHGRTQGEPPVPGDRTEADVAADAFLLALRTLYPEQVSLARAAAEMLSAHNPAVAGPLLEATRGRPRRAQLVEGLRRAGNLAAVLDGKNGTAPLGPEPLRRPLPGPLRRLIR